MEYVIAAIVETVRSMTNFMSTKYIALVNFHGNIKALQTELEKLTSLKIDVEESIELAKREGILPTAQINDWLRQVEEFQREVNPLLEESSRDDAAVQGWCSNCNMSYRYQLSKGLAEKIIEAKQHLDSGPLLKILPDRKSPILPIQPMLVPSLAGQNEAMEMLQQLVEFLNDDGIKRIAVWGMGGVGKTTLVKNLNNNLESSSMTVSFDMVIWITVSKDLDLKRIQSDIAERLNLELEAGESMPRRANRLLRRLMARKKFLFILDDVWEKIDLDKVGIPQGDEDTYCKILLTTRSFNVCREMMTDKEIKVDVLSDEASWNLFAQSAGDIVESDGIEPLAREIAKECCGLPLAIKTIGKSMRAKTMIELWKNALWQLRHPASRFDSVEKEVYLRLKLSYNSLPSKILQRCFLYCSLFPENYSITVNDLMHCWMADGLIDEHQTLEETFNNGVALIENLKDSCMLECGETIGTVKMHGVVRDVAIWISSIEDESGFFSQSGISLPEMPEKLQASYRRVSFMKSMLTRLPSRLLGCYELTVLFLQGNPLKKIPEGFFREIRGLKYLNLSSTLITSLPPSLLHLGELRILLLGNCSSLEKLLPLGALHKLQVLDLSGTRLRELPKETGKLVNLRELNLSHTRHLDNIEAGTVSGLLSLEALDMSFSAYKWALNCNIEGKASFDELLSLKCLSILHIRQDTVECLALDIAWLRRLRTFNIRIGPRSCDPNYQLTQDGEKRVILRKVDLFDRGLEGLFCTASSLDLVGCGGISELSEVVARGNWCNLASLKSLTIKSCDWMTNLISGEIQHTMLPNLEHLTLGHLKNLETISNGDVPNGGCLSRLRTIEVTDCPKLKNLISYAFLQKIQNLEEIKASDCRRIKSIIAGRVPQNALSKLKRIELRGLIHLRIICSRPPAWPILERIEVSNCPKLEKLPLSISNAITVKEIKGDPKWWNNLVWEDDGIKISLEQRFQACPEEVRLERDNTYIA